MESRVSISWDLNTDLLTDDGKSLIFTETINLYSHYTFIYITELFN